MLSERNPLAAVWALVTLLADLEIAVIVFMRVRDSVAADAWFGSMYLAAALAVVTLGVVGAGSIAASAWVASMRHGLRQQLAQLGLALSVVRTGAMAVFLFPLFFMQGLALFFGPTSVALLFAALYCKGWLDRRERRLA